MVSQTTKSAPRRTLQSDPRGEDKPQLDPVVEAELAALFWLLELKAAPPINGYVH